MPQGIRGWAIWGAAQVLLTFAIKLLIKLVDNAVIGWGDDRIAELFGITSPSATVAFNWTLPFALAAIGLWLFHHFTTAPLREALAQHSGGARFSATGIVHGPSPVRTWIQKVEPSHLVILGLIIASIGAIWMLFRTPTDPKLSDLQSQLRSAQIEVERLRQSPTPQGQTSAKPSMLTGRPVSGIEIASRLEVVEKELAETKAKLEAKNRELAKVDAAVQAAPAQTQSTSLISPDRFYSRAEKERIVDTMNFINERFAKAGYPLRNNAVAGYNELSGKSSPEQFDPMIERIKSDQGIAEQLDKDLDKIRNESQSYAMSFAELLAAKPVYFETFRAALNDFANMLTVYRNLAGTAGPSSEQLRLALISSGRNAAVASYGFEKWMQDCEQKMQQARKQLSQ